MQQLLKTRRKKKLSDYLLSDTMTSEEAQVFFIELITKIKEVFRRHIGEADYITSADLFEVVYGVNPARLDIYRRIYWWRIIKHQLRRMRMNLTLFVISDNGKLYVLQTEQEAQIYNKKIDEIITALKIAKQKSQQWINKKGWLAF